MLYLLDANVLIDANRDYYPIKRVPEFWEWIVYVGNEGEVKIPIEIYEEFKGGKDELGEWARDNETKEALIFQEEAEVTLVSKVIDSGYASDLTDNEIEKLGRDPFLIAYALGSKRKRCVVTTEGSKPKRIRANRHIPDVCDSLGLACCDTFQFARALNFSTSWKSIQSMRDLSRY